MMELLCFFLIASSVKMFQTVSTETWDVHRIMGQTWDRVLMDLEGIDLL